MQSGWGVSIKSKIFVLYVALVLRIIHLIIQPVVFGCVGFAPSFSSSLISYCWNNADSLQTKNLGILLAKIPHLESRDVYLPDLVIRQLAQIITSRPEVLQDVSSIVEEEPLPPYPGKPAIFLPTRDNWQYNDSRVELRRTLTLQSATPDSLFSTIHVFGYRSGGFKMQALLTSRMTEDVRIYFQSHRFSASQQDPYIALTCRAQEAQLLKILEDNNTIPDEQLQLMHRLVESGNWLTVTPVPDERTAAPSRITSILRQTDQSN